MEVDVVVLVIVICLMIVGAIVWLVFFQNKDSHDKSYGLYVTEGFGNLSYLNPYTDQPIVTAFENSCKEKGFECSGEVKKEIREDKEWHLSYHLYHYIFTNGVTARIEITSNDYGVITKFDILISTPKGSNTAFQESIRIIFFRTLANLPHDTHNGISHYNIRYTALVYSGWGRSEEFELLSS